MSSRILEAKDVSSRTPSLAAGMRTDGDNLFAPPATSPDMLFVAVRQGRPFAVPCRPTHPDVAMTLWKGRSGSAAGVAEIRQGHDVTYHRHTGFFIYTSGVFYNGLFHCRAQLNTTVRYHDLYMHFQREFFLLLFMCISPVRAPEL